MRPSNDFEIDPRIVTHILTKDQLAAIGSVAVESTALEELVDGLIWMLAGMNEKEGRLFTHTMNLKPKLDLLSELGKPQLRSKKKLDQCTKLISELKEAVMSRNIAIHGKWLTNGVDIFQVLIDGAEKHPPPIAQKLSKQGKPTDQKSAAEIGAIAELLARLSDKLRAFSYTSWRRVPSPKKQLLRLLAQTQTPDQKSPKARAGKPRPNASQG